MRAPLLRPGPGPGRSRVQDTLKTRAATSIACGSCASPALLEAAEVIIWLRSSRGLEPTGRATGSAHVLLDGDEAIPFLACESHKTQSSPGRYQSAPKSIALQSARGCPKPLFIAMVGHGTLPFDILRGHAHPSTSWLPTKLTIEPSPR